MTVEQTITEPMIIHGIGTSASDRRERAQALLEEVGLPGDHLKRYPHEFSGGQRQRICIARTLSLEPKFIICDESVSALDVSVQAQVLNLLKELQAKRGLTYIFISHDLSVVKFMSDIMCVMQAGRIAEAGPAEGIYENPGRRTPSSPRPSRGQHRPHPDAPGPAAAGRGCPPGRPRLPSPSCAPRGGGSAVARRRYQSAGGSWSSGTHSPSWSRLASSMGGAEGISSIPMGAAKSEGISSAPSPPLQPPPLAAAPRPRSPCRGWSARGGGLRRARVLAGVEAVRRAVDPDGVVLPVGVGADAEALPRAVPALPDPEDGPRPSPPGTR